MAYVSPDAIRAFEAGKKPPDLYGKHKFVTKQGTIASNRTIRRWYESWEDGDAFPFEETEPTSPGQDQWQFSEGTATYSGSASPEDTLDGILDRLDLDWDVWQLEKWQWGSHVGIRKNTIRNLSFDDGKVTGSIVDDGGFTKEKMVSVKLWFTRKPGANINTALLNIIEDLKEYAPSYDPPKRKEFTDGHLLVPQLWDYHFNNLPIDGAVTLEAAEEKFKAVTDRMLSLATSMPYPIDRIVMPVGNDLVQTDNLNGTTTRGTPVDSVHDPRDAAEVAFRCMAEFIEKLLVIAPVDILVVPSNHDRFTTFFLGLFLQARFHKHPDFSIDTDRKPRKYYLYGKCLFGMDHGSENKAADLGAIMAEETNGLTGRSSHKEFWRGHLHQRMKMHYEYMPGKGFFVRYLPSLSKTDDWHHKYAYISSGRSAELLFYSKTGLAAEIPVPAIDK